MRLRFLPIFFFFSGASSLLYQMTWQRVLGIYYGVGAVSSAIVISIFMLGLGLGSLFATPLMAKFRLSPIAAYILIELMIGIFGIISLPVLGYLGKATAGADYINVVVYTSTFLFVPTLLMGATLPVAVSCLNDSDPDLLRNVSQFYFINTLGASFGCLAASFLMIGPLGLDGTTYAAAILNVALAGSLYLWHRSNQTGALGGDSAPPVVQGETLPSYLLFPAVVVSGFIAIGYELIWFRVVGILLKDSVYTFSLILAVYLLAIALGSFSATHVLRWSRLSRTRLYLLANGLIAVIVAASILLFYHFNGFVTGGMTEIRTAMILPGAPDRISQLPHFFLILAWCGGVAAFFIFLPAFLMGISFPLTASLGRFDPTKPTRSVGTIYFTTILGNVAGSLVTGFVLLPLIGTERSILAFVLLGIGFLLLLAIQLGNGVRRWSAVGAGTAMAAAAIFLLPGPGLLVSSLHPSFDGWMTYLDEGVEGTVFSAERDGVLRTYINGSLHGGRPGYSFYVQVATVLSRVSDPGNVLVIGLGTGSILEGLLLDPRVKNVTLVELNSTVLHGLRRVATIQRLMSDPRVTIVHEDGRRWLGGHERKFDLIMMDPLRTQTAFSNNIYSGDFFRLIKAHLAPRGAFMAFTDERTVLPRTFAKVFENAELYCTFMLASDPPADEDVVRARYASFVSNFAPPTRAEIEKRACPPPADRASMLGAPGLPVNTDYHPITEYYLGQAFQALFH